MQAKNCKERIIRLKNKRVERGLTIDKVIDMCGGFPSESTITKFFAKGGEDKSYRESTVAALELVLFGEVFNAEIAIPVEDVVKAQKESAELAERTRRVQALQIAQQRANIRVRDFIIIALVLYEVFVIVYDRLNPHIGFYSADNITVWVVQVTLIVVLSAILSVYILRTRLRARQMRQEEQT